MATLKIAITLETRPPLMLTLSWLLVLIADFFRLYTVILTGTYNVFSCLYLLRFTLVICIYICILYDILMARRHKLNFLLTVTSIQDTEQSLLLNSHTEISQPQYACPNRVVDFKHASEDTAYFFSKLTFWWVQPFMIYGYTCKLLTQGCLFLLPRSLSTPVICDIFAKNLKKSDTLEVKHALLATFNKTFGYRYYPLGLVKVFADLIAFAGPLLLNYLVNFIEDPSEAIWHGYLYAGFLFTSTLLSSTLSTHYSFQVSKVQVAVRAAVTSTVYRKAIYARRGATQKNHTTGSGSLITTGEIVNLMSTDCDRIANFCASFHQFWSLPLQIAVALYLLYQQLGISYLAGLVFTLLLIPINRKIAVKIGILSTTMMAHKDNRVNVMNEILHGIRVIKFYAWEKLFEAKINAIREKELISLRGRKYLDALCVYLWATTPILISILTFGTYVLLNNNLTAATVFTSLALFNMLIGPLNSFPWVVNGMMEAWVSLTRIESFLDNTEINFLMFYDTVLHTSTEYERHHKKTDKYLDNDPNITPLVCTLTADSAEGLISPIVVSVYNGCFSFIKDGNCVLRDVYFTAQQSTFICVTGNVGSGKTSLLLGVMGELVKENGSIFLDPAYVKNGSGYVAQEPWIQNATLRDNILFGKQYDATLYERVLFACALLEDIESMPLKDNTEIGENGVNLSGGQKSRVALARAVYQEKKLYILDSPLAALDAHVASHVLKHCIQGILTGTTRIMSTQNKEALKQADNIYTVADQTVYAGIRLMEATRDIAENRPVVGSDKVSVSASPTSSSSDNPISTSLLDIKKMPTSNVQVVSGLISTEKRSKGVVELRVYAGYWSAVGSSVAISVFVSLFLMQGSRNVSDWWLSYWVTNAQDNDTNGVDNDTFYYLKVYGILSGVNTCLTLVRAYIFAYAGLHASKIIHSEVLCSLLRAPIAFFDATPIGRIINRMSSDVFGVDDSLPFTLNILFAQAFGLLGSITITCYGLPYFALFLPFLTLLYYRIQRYYRQTSREVKRLGSISRSPIYAHFSETLTGVVSIRAFRSTTRFQNDNERYLDANQLAQYTEQAVSTWLNFRLQLIGVAMVTIVAFLAVVEHHFGTVNPGLVGLAISYALSITNLLQGLVSSFTESEKEMIAVERLLEYIQEPCESNVYGPSDVPANWPYRGSIIFKNVSLRYPTVKTSALLNFSLTICPGEVVAFVGRTGAGKTSIFQALFRIVDIFEGSIVIDGLDCATLPRSLVRSRLAIIPQDPVLFSGTIRYNLDPHEMYSDKGT